MHYQGDLQQRFSSCDGKERAWEKRKFSQGRLLTSEWHHGRRRQQRRLVRRSLSGGGTGLPVFYPPEMIQILRPSRPFLSSVFAAGTNSPISCSNGVH